MCYVLDGGSLLHHVSWPQDVTYSDIINECVTNDDTAMLQLCSTDKAVDLQQRISSLIAEEVDELYSTLTYPEICLSVSRCSHF